MSTRRSRISLHSFALGAVLAMGSACAGGTPVAPDAADASMARLASLPAQAQTSQALAALRRATARYHNLDAALADGFVLLHGCEVRPGEGAVGTVYVHMDRLLDGVVDPSLPDALVYEPGEQPRLVAAELAVPVALWNEPEPPSFLGIEFQSEEEFGVYGLHVWLWRNNPEGLFGEANPLVSCDEEPEVI